MTDSLNTDDLPSEQKGLLELAGAVTLGSFALYNLYLFSPMPLTVCHSPDCAYTGVNPIYLTLILSTALLVDGAFRILGEGVVERMVNKS